MKPMLPVFLLATSLLFTTAQAQVQGGGPAASQPVPLLITKFTIAGQPLIKPDLDYILLPDMERTESGDAAPHYHLAIEMAFKPTPPKNDLGDIPNYYDAIDTQLHDTPLAKLDEKNVQLIIDSNRNSLHELDNGALCEYCNFESSVRKDGYRAMLPYLGPLRNLANVLALSIRLDIKNHHWKEAHQKLQTGYALAQHLGEGDTLIDSLVGISIAGNMNHCVQDWIQEPGSPNLYWPLAYLPHPFNDLRRGIAFERADLYISFPELRAMRDGTASGDQWINFSNRFREFSFNKDEFPIEDSHPNPLMRDSFGVISAAFFYPTAKKYMVSHGMSAADVEALPVPAALGKYFDRSYSEAADAVFKWNAIPFYQAQGGTEEFDGQKNDPNTNILAKIFLPSLNRAHFLSVSLDREIDMLRIVEAIRAYAAANHALPNSLDDLTLPAPLDVSTGKPFLYEHAGNTATLTSPPLLETPTGSSPYRGAKFEITLTP